MNSGSVSFGLTSPNCEPGGLPGHRRGFGRYRHGRQRQVGFLLMRSTIRLAAAKAALVFGDGVQPRESLALLVSFLRLPGLAIGAREMKMNLRAVGQHVIRHLQFLDGLPSVA